MTEDNTYMTAALGYAAQGYSVFPIKPRMKTPLTLNGYKDSSCDPEQIRAWWTYTPDANIGIATGEVSGFFAFDIDGMEGEKALNVLEQKHGKLLPTFEVISGSGGRHLYYQWPEKGGIRCSAGQLGEGLDIRGDGGYIVAPPSIHPCGQPYSVSVDSEDQVCPAPDWFLRLLQNRHKAGDAHNSANWSDFIYGAREGQRNHALASIAGKLIQSGLQFQEALEICRALNQRCNPPLSDEEVIRTVKSIARTDAANKKAEGENTGIDIISMDKIEMKPINWLWPDRIACGKITVIAGNPGLGKSQITAALSAIVSIGGKWPDADQAVQAGEVIILSAEDDPGDTIKPRLIAAGANLEKCHVLQSVRTKNGQGKITARTFSLSEDIERLGQIIEKIGNVRLVIIDPISAYLGDTDSHNNADMRGLLAPLSEMAMRHNAAIILVTHLNKSKEQDMIGRVIGSIGLIAAARAGYAVVKDEERPEIRYFLPIKNNVGNDRDGFVFHIEGVVLEQGIATSKICWHSETVEAHKILYPEQKNQTNGAQEFLRGLLDVGPKLTAEIFDEAEGIGYSKAVMQRAATRLGVKRKKLGMGQGWEWRLSSNRLDKIREDSEDAEDDRAAG